MVTVPFVDVDSLLAWNEAFFLSENSLINGNTDRYLLIDVGERQ